MEKVKSYSNHLLFSLTLSSALFLAAPAWGQAFSSVYPAPNGEDSEIYQITPISPSAGSSLLSTGVRFGEQPLANSSFPHYKDWRLLVTGQDGSAIAQRIFSTGFDDRAFEAERTADDGMMIVGHTGQGFTARDRHLAMLPATDQNASPLLVKIASNGLPAFQTSFEMGGLDDHAYSIVRDNNNTFLILGRSFRDVQGRYVITLMQVNANGGVVSANILHDAFSSHLFPRKMIRISDGGFMIAAVREVADTPIMHAPDPVDATIMGQEIVLIKLNANHQIEFATLVRPVDGNGIGVKDLVEHEEEEVFFVGTSVRGDYIMTIDGAGVITQAARFSSGAGDIDWEPKSIARIPSGFAVSGTMDVGVGVPRIEIDPALLLLEAKRHQFGKHINSILTVSPGLQFLAGATTDDALILRWLVGQVDPLCNVADAPVTMGRFPIETRKLDMVAETTLVTSVSRDLMSSPPATRVNNCILPPAAKMGATSAAPASEAAVSVSPNPAQDQLQLFVPGEEDAAYTLHDLQGRLLASGTLRPGSQVLPVADLARGVYVLRVHNTQFNSTHRISLQH